MESKACNGIMSHVASTDLISSLVYGRVGIIDLMEAGLDSIVLFEVEVSVKVKSGDAIMYILIVCIGCTVAGTDLEIAYTAGRRHILAARARSKKSNT